MKPNHLTFVAERNANGKPRAYLQGIPARDLDAQDLAALTDDQIAAAIGSGLYSASGKPAAHAGASVTAAIATEVADNGN